eukprot:gene6308-biopygen13082
MPLLCPQAGRGQVDAARQGEEAPPARGRDETLHLLVDGIGVPAGCGDEERAVVRVEAAGVVEARCRGRSTAAGTPPRHATGRTVAAQTLIRRGQHSRRQIGPRQTGDLDLSGRMRREEPRDYPECDVYGGPVLGWDDELYMRSHMKGEAHFMDPGQVRDAPLVGPQGPLYPGANYLFI